MPMQPSPSSETSRPWLPSLRVLMLFAPSLEWGAKRSIAARLSTGYADILLAHNLECGCVVLAHNLERSVHSQPCVFGQRAPQAVDAGLEVHHTVPALSRGQFRRAQLRPAAAVAQAQVVRVHAGV